MKLSIFGVLIAVTVLGFSSAQAAISLTAKTVADKCVVKKGGVSFGGGERSEVKRTLETIQAVNIYKHATLLSGGLVPIAKGSLEFQPVDVLLTISSANNAGYPVADQAIPATQETLVYNNAGVQIKNESDLPNDGFRVVYKFRYSDKYFEVLLMMADDHIADHVKRKSTVFSYTYTASPSLPPNIQKEQSGSVEADLKCL